MLGHDPYVPSLGMATLREKRPGVWEVRVFTGTGPERAADPAVQDDPRRQARRDQRSPPSSRSGPARSSSAGRSVSDVLDAWVDAEPRHVGAVVGARPAEPSGRHQEGPDRHSCRSPGCRSAMSSAGTRACGATAWRDAGIKNQHGVLRAALSQAVRWGWVGTNVASLARLRSTKIQRREVMTLDDVRAVMAAAAAIDPAAAAHPPRSRRSPAPDAPSWLRCGGPTYATAC